MSTASTPPPSSGSNNSPIQQQPITHQKNAFLYDAKKDLVGKFYQVLSNVSEHFNPQAAQRYKALAQHSFEDKTKNADRIKNLITSGTLLASSRNIAAKEVISTKEDKKACFDLIEKLKLIPGAVPANGKSGRVTTLENLNPKTAITDGICAGIRLEIANDFLAGGFTPEEISNQHSKGSTAQAAANQALYSALEGNTTSTLINLQVMEELVKAGKLDNPEAIKQYLPGIDALIINDMGLFKDQLMTKHEAKFSERDAAFIVAHYEFNHSHLPAAAPPPKAEEPPTLSTVWKEVLGKLKETFGVTKPPNAVKTDNLSRISDPILHDLYKEVISSKANGSTYALIAEARGLVLSDVRTSSFFDSNDEPALDQLASLGDGVFGINIEMKIGSHAITLIKEGEQIYIFDPNGPFIRADGSELKEIMSQLLSYYPSAKGKDSYHNIRFNQISAEITPDLIWKENDLIM